MKRIWLMLLFVGAQGLAIAQQAGEGVFDTVQTEAVVEPPVEDSEYYEEDYEEPLPLYFPADSMKDIRSRKEYDYMKNLDSALRNLKMEMNNKPDEPSRSIFEISIVKLLLWGLAILAVLYMLYQLFAGQQSLFSKNKRLDHSPEEEHHTEDGLSAMVLSQQAAARGDFRLAVRYHYMHLLQLMAEKNFIIPLPQKTNNQYLGEVRQKPFYNDFATLTLQYEYVWFGEFMLSKEQFALVDSGFKKFAGSWLK